MQILKRAARTAAVLMIALLVVSVCAAHPGSSLRVHAASEKTSIGLAEHGLKAYRDGWKYVYGGYGNFTSSGVRSSDCSGLIYSYLCWTDDSSAVSPNWSYPRTATQQVNRSVESGTLDTLPRTHGLLITTSGSSHIGIYVGNNMVVDNSTWGVNMRLDSIDQHGWRKWHKLGCVTYPTNGWYLFDGDYYYYENGEYVVNTTRTIDGVTYTFGSDGLSSKAPGSGSNDGYDESDGNTNARTTTGVRLRKGPGTEYGTITVLSEGTRMNVINTENSAWYAVETTSGQKGYVSAKYIKITGPVVEQDAPEVEAPETDDSSVNAAEGESAKVTTAVHLRSGKSTSSKSLGVISAGTSVKAADIGDNSWYKVYVNGKTGYMFREYVRLDSTPAPEQNASISGTSRTAMTTAGVHLRSGRGTNFASLLLVNKNTPITVTDTSDSSWYGVSYNGKNGFISSQYISLPGEPAPENTNTTTVKPDTTAWTAAGVYLRKGRGTEHETVTLLNAHTPLIILDTSNSEWYEVSANGMTGYVYSQYIQTDISEIPAEIMVTDAYLNLRKSAGQNSDVLAVIPENTAVAVTNKDNNEWYAVSYNGKTGFVSSEYLK